MYTDDELTLDRLGAGSSMAIGRLGTDLGESGNESVNTLDDTSSICLGGFSMVA